MQKTWPQCKYQWTGTKKNEDLMATENSSLQNGFRKNKKKTFYVKFNNQNKEDIPISIKLKNRNNKSNIWECGSINS